jgi:hypothetical protein
MKNVLKKAYVAPDITESTRYGEDGKLTLNPPKFDDDPKHLISFWRKGIKWMQLERVR